MTNNRPHPEKTVLVVEDEPKLAQLLCDYLASSGYRRQTLSDGNAVIPWVRQHPPDLILLDLMLPGKDGMSICQELRAFTDVPIIMVTARVEEVDRLLGLDVGADDYVCKPFSPREVMARVQAVLRRARREGQTDGSISGITVDDDRQEIHCNGRLLELTLTEYRLLSLLASRSGKVFSRDRLLDCLHDEGQSASDRTVDSHIKNLRRKLSTVAPGQEIIASIYGVGYRLDLPTDTGH
jgi:two-component system, OmpR family, response regulator BaeR